MNRVKISLYGLYTYDDSIFDNLALPELLETERENIVNNILLNSIELESLYGDPGTVKTALGIFSKSRLQAWTAIANVLAQEYNPIWNKDGTITYKYGSKHESRQYGETDATNKYGNTKETRQYGNTKETQTYGVDKVTSVNGEVNQTDNLGTRTDNESIGARSDTETLGSHQDIHVNGKEHSVTEGQVSAFNSSSYQPSSKSITDTDSITNTDSYGAQNNSSTVGAQANSKRTGEQTNTYNISEHTDIDTRDARTDSISNDTHTDNIISDTHVDNMTEKAHNDNIYNDAVTDVQIDQGNIGITTTQSMIEEELDLRTKYDTINIITNEIIQRFCLMIY